MTIADLAVPVLLRVLPTTVGVLVLTAAVAALPVLLPRFVAWLKGPVPAATRRTPVRADGDAESEQTYSI